jgi:hypothetical protein
MAMSGASRWLGRMNAALGMRQKRPFKMNAGGPGDGLQRSRRVGEQFGQTGQRAQGRVHGSGDGGGQVAAGSVRGQKAAHGGERLGRGFHDVVAGCAVGVDIEERWRQRCAGKVQDLTWGQGAELCRALRMNRNDSPILNRNDGRSMAVVPFAEPCRGQHHSHFKRLMAGHCG